MSSLPVFADALSRLHADIAIVRLIRAGIRAERISAVFPQRRAPNSVCCWLKNFQRVNLRSALPIAVAGLLAPLLKRDVHSAKAERDLDSLGLSPEMADRILEKTAEGMIVLCVHARNESEAAIAWHIFHHVGAENIVCPNHEVTWTVREPAVLAPEWTGASIAA